MNIESLEKIYNLRFYLFSIRFFPLFFFTILIFVYIIPNYSFLNIYVLYITTPNKYINKLSLF